VKETGREIAAAAYPLSFFNEWDDDLTAYGKEKTILSGKINTSESNLMLVYGEFIEDIMTGGFLTGNIDRLQKITNDSPDEYGSNNIENSVIRKWTSYYYNLQDKGKYAAVSAILFKQLDTYKLNLDNLSLCLVYLPQSKYGFDHSKSDPRYQEAGFFPEQDFSIEDVVIQAQYTVIIPLPFLTDNTVLLKSTVVERAWLQGGNGVYTNRDDKGFLETLQKEVDTRVYVTRTGEKYHLSDCRYLRKSKIPITLEEAKKSYQPCKVCRPP
jgi:hypothetical protein